jgi:hypothetical protein
MTCVFPIPLRTDFVAQVHVPHDLSQKEAQRICRLVMALIDRPKPLPEILSE